MADNRALMAAFQKVRADVDQALEQTRRKEEAARAAEEAKRAQERREKRQGSAAAKQSGKASAGEANSARESKSEQSMVKAARVTPLQASSSAAEQPSAKAPENTSVRAPRTYSPKGAFGAVLAGAAQASGAVFRESPALQGESAGKRSKAPLTNKAASADKTVQNGKREILHPRFESASAAKANAGHREDRSGRANRPLQVAAGRSAKADSRQNRQQRPRRSNLPESAQARTENGREDSRARSERSARPKLFWAERRNPIPPFELMPGLPVSERAADVVKAIKENQVVIVCGETGSGKTTQLPKICLMAGRGETGRIGHTQPRRIAASSIAKRIAEELKTPLGDVVGYKVRFTDQTASGATIKLMTDGILLAETQGDPLLKAYDTIIIDEAHERSINIDFLLGYLKRLQIGRAHV